ncbi:uncharacterized protein LOC134192169 isoform X2 [Corticium candelabrum]|uniref:uncharacterized protein LOC134192169 isoform X2 n=1 Tax=Corticium candelabrum TaxID=121492 RepID=UPI002E25997A|nr:uncharacterized protein LOC134192169 isoform X2 [Corticium candelabrum]
MATTRLSFIVALLLSLLVLLVFLTHFNQKEKQNPSLLSAIHEVIRTRARDKVSYTHFNQSRDVKNEAKVRPDFSKVQMLLLFIGYPRSGHTLVACLLDAHPHVMLSNEYNLIHKWPELSDLQKNREFLFSELYGNAVGFVASDAHKRSDVKSEVGGKVQHKVTAVFNYSVPHQWNGQYDEYIQVIGDKKGGGTTRAFESFRHKFNIKDIAEVMGVPIRFIHVIRNPFDNIATMAIRSVTTRQFISDGGVLNDSDTLKSEVKHYFSLVNINRQLHSILHVMDVHSADIIENPEKTLLRICEFLEIECDEKYLRDCASIVFPSPSKTRNNVVWPPKVINEVYSHMRKYNFLTRYNFMSN